MADMQIISEAPTNIYQLKKALEKIRKRGNELNFRAAKTEEYLNQVVTIKNADELFSKIAALEIPRLKEQHIHKIIDTAPTTVNDLKVVLQGYTITINNDAMKKIVTAISEFLESK